MQFRQCSIFQSNTNNFCFKYGCLSYESIWTILEFVQSLQRQDNFFKSLTSAYNYFFSEQNHLIKQNKLNDFTTLNNLNVIIGLLNSCCSHLPIRIFTPLIIFLLSSTQISSQNMTSDLTSRHAMQIRLKKYLWLQ